MFRKNHALWATIANVGWLPVLVLMTTAFSLDASGQNAVVISQDCPPGSTQKELVLKAGEKDNFRQPSEPTQRGATLNTYSPSWNDFDDGKSAFPLGHTFTDLPCIIIGAYLTFSVSPIDRPKGNEIIGLQAIGGNKFAWSELLKTINPRWPEPFTHTLDLSKLPTGKGSLNFLDYLASGELDVFFGDNVAVDYLELRIIYCDFTDCNDNCIPDETDINNGTSLDVNRNGIPDECETPTGGGTGTVDIYGEPYYSIGVGDDCCAWLVLSPDVVLEGEVGSYTITNDYNPAMGGQVIDCFPIGTTQVTFFVTTATGLTVQYTTVVHVYDNKPPVITPKN